MGGGVQYRPIWSWGSEAATMGCWEWGREMCEPVFEKQWLEAVCSWRRVVCEPVRSNKVDGGGAIGITLEDTEPGVYTAIVPAPRWGF